MYAVLASACTSIPQCWSIWTDRIAFDPHLLLAPRDFCSWRSFEFLFIDKVFPSRILRGILTRFIGYKGERYRLALWFQSFLINFMQIFRDFHQISFRNYSTNAHWPFAQQPIGTTIETIFFVISSKKTLKSNLLLTFRTNSCKIP